MFYENRAVGQTQGLPMQNYVYQSSLPNQTYFDSRSEGQSVNPVDVDYYNKSYEEKSPKSGSGQMYGADDMSTIYHDDAKQKFINARWIQKSPGTLNLTSLPSSGMVVPGFEQGRKIGYGAEDSAEGFPYQRWMQTKPGTVEKRMNRGGSVAPGFDSGRAVGYGAAKTISELVDEYSKPWRKWALIGAVGIISYILIEKFILKKKKVFGATDFKLKKAWKKLLK